jgi:hypothetical protein
VRSGSIGTPASPNPLHVASPIVTATEQAMPLERLAPDTGSFPGKLPGVSLEGPAHDPSLLSGHRETTVPGSHSCCPRILPTTLMVSDLCTSP